MLNLLGLGPNKTALYETMVRAYAPELFRFAYWICRDRAVAEDLVQETCLRAWKSWGKLNDAQATKSWLFTILRREHARLYERKTPERVWLDDDQLEAMAGHIEMPLLEVREALAMLPENYRTPLLLQVLGGFSCQEIAAVLDASEDAVLARVSRARRMMREALDGHPEAAFVEVKK
ncbi:MAG: sigma-70 family RNA polymerase sigma factor [Thiobacillus sp.]|nr:sigma-70 family RNA polymerase sigma factor [Thiobacillus sp.]